MLEHRAAKVAILQMKLDEVEQKIEAEKSTMEHVEKVMPVKIEQNNANDSIAAAAIDDAIAELQKFYSADCEGSSYEGMAFTIPPSYR